jgi:hypothetical protein
MIYVWHNNLCKLLVKPISKKGIKRNALIELLDSGDRIVVPWRSLRKSIRLKVAAEGFEPPTKGL